MKANAPEKIYLHPSVKDGEYNRHWLIRKVNQNSVEYVRTDAFIEKACSWLKENKDKYLYNTGEKGEYIPTCSRKMIDDFEEYLKK